MQKGVSIFIEEHEQGCPHMIAGIYSPRMKTEEEMRTELLSLLGSTEFESRSEPIFINHTHVYAKHLLGEKIEGELHYTLSRFMPEALEPETLPIDPMKFQYYDVGAYNFIWDNRMKKELHEYRNNLLKERVATRERRSGEK